MLCANWGCYVRAKRRAIRTPSQRGLLFSSGNCDNSGSSCVGSGNDPRYFDTCLELRLGFPVGNIESTHRATAFFRSHFRSVVVFCIREHRQNARRWHLGLGRPDACEATRNRDQRTEWQGVRPRRLRRKSQFHGHSGSLQPDYRHLGFCASASVCGES